MGKMFAVRSSKFIYYFSGSGKLTSSMCCCRSYVPYITDLFLLENPKSNSQSLREYNVMLYLLELWYNRAF